MDREYNNEGKIIKTKKSIEIHYKSNRDREYREAEARDESYEEVTP